jgi:DNA-binding response OmpR family regulator
MKILIVEDNKELNEIIYNYLTLEGFICYRAYDGIEALNMYSENKIDLVLSDIMMPLLDGYNLAKEIRDNNKEIPIIFMSAKDDKMAKKIGYKAGIDDYIVKPFDLDELVFKINAINRRLNISNKSSITIKNFYIDNDSREAFINGIELQLSKREFDILYSMVSNPNKTYTRSRLMEEFWDYDSSASSRTVDVYFAKLREKTKDADGFIIDTVHGLGYKVVLK